MELQRLPEAPALHQALTEQVSRQGASLVVELSDRGLERTSSSMARLSPAALQRSLRRRDEVMGRPPCWGR